MDAVEFLKERARMCVGRGCTACPMGNASNEKMVACGDFQEEHPERAVSIVEQWAKEHPKRTYLSVLLEKFPNIPLATDGTPNFLCPYAIFGNNVTTSNGCDGNNCVKCWNREYKGKQL